jgi:hypothetical protein
VPLQLQACRRPECPCTGPLEGKVPTPEQMTAVGVSYGTVKP